NPATGETVSMRSKESAHDYRYFPEPDLVPLRIGDDWLERVRASMPELPTSRRARFVSQYGLREYDAGVLTASRPVSEYFEETAKAAGRDSEAARLAANWITGDLAALLKAGGKEITESPVSPLNLGHLVG